MGPRRGTHAQALGRHFHHRGGHQKPCAERHKIAQVALNPARPNQHQAAGNIGKRGQQSQQNGKLRHR